jgi:hypothetical protein
MISNEQTDLLELIQRASEMSEGLVRMDAVRRLKRCSLQRMDALALFEFARKAEDPGWRTTAAQVLGFHRIATSYPDLVDGLVGAATVEQDLEARKALVYAVRGTEGAARLLDHPQPEVAREATSGLAESVETWKLILDALFSGLSPSLESRVLGVIGRPDEAAAWVVTYLLNSSFGSDSDPTDRAGLLFRVIDQALAFNTLMDAQDKLERTHEQIWPSLARRARKRVLLDLFTTAVCETGLDPRLAQAVADRVLTGQDFLRAQGRTLRSLLKGLSGRDGEQLMLVVAHTFDESGRKDKLLLAELMMMVGKEIPDTMGTVSAIVSDWKDAPPEMMLKVKQSRMGIR